LGDYSAIRLAVKSCFLLLFVIVWAGCGPVGPDYEQPVVEMPDVWQQKAVKGIGSGDADIQRWWEILGDPVLDELICRAGQGNLELAQAFHRIEQSRADLGFAKGELFPQADFVGDYQRTRFSDDGIFGDNPSTNQGNVNLHDLGVDAFWEVDVFGRIRRNIESAEGNLGASVEDYRDVLVSLYAEVAFNYVEYRALELRIELAESNIDLQEKTLKLTQDLFKAGIVPQLDVQQAKLNLATTESAIPPLRFGKTEAANRICVLLGLMPGGVDELLEKDHSLPKLPGRVVVDLPVELLRQRPDIRRAERVLAGQSALVGAATAELYPVFSLTGSFIYQSRRLDNLINRSNRSYAYGPRVEWNIFNAGRIRNNIRFEEELTKEVFARYEKTVLLAMEETENAMTAYVEEYNRKDSLKESVDASKESVSLVETLYKTGLTDFQNVLDMQRSLFTQQDQLAESGGKLVQSLILIYKSLGGGWGQEQLEITNYELRIEDTASGGDI